MDIHDQEKSFQKPSSLVDPLKTSFCDDSQQSVSWQTLLDSIIPALDRIPGLSASLQASCTFANSLTPYLKDVFDPSIPPTVPKVLVDSLSATVQQLTLTIVDKGNTIDELQRKLGTIGTTAEIHSEEASSFKYQLSEQFKIIDDLRAEVDKLSKKPRVHGFSCQVSPPPPPCTRDAHCQATVTAASTRTQTCTEQPPPQCNAATDTDSLQAAVAPTLTPTTDTGTQTDPPTTQQQHTATTQTELPAELTAPGPLGRAASVPVPAPTTQSAPPPQPQSAAPGHHHKPQAAKRAASAGGACQASEAEPANASLKWDLDLMTKKFQRACADKVEAEERLCKVEAENTELVSLASFYKERAELALAAHEDLRLRVQAAKAARAARHGATATASDAVTTPSAAPQPQTQTPSGPPHSHASTQQSAPQSSHEAGAQPAGCREADSPCTSGEAGAGQAEGSSTKEDPTHSGTAKVGQEDGDTAAGECAPTPTPASSTESI